MSNKKIIQGICPNCKTKNKIRFVDYYYNNDFTPYAKNIPRCEICDCDEISIRKINNRRYKVI